MRSHSADQQLDFKEVELNLWRCSEAVPVSSDQTAKWGRATWAFQLGFNQQKALGEMGFLHYYKEFKCFRAVWSDCTYNIICKVKIWADDDPGSSYIHYEDNEGNLISRLLIQKLWRNIILNMSFMAGKATEILNSEGFILWEPWKCADKE